MSSSSRSASKIYHRVKFQVEHGFGPRLLGTDVEPLGHRFENQRCLGQLGNEQERVGKEQAEGETQPLGNFF